MGAKKKPEGGAGLKKDTSDDSTEKLYRAYRRNLGEYGVSMPRKLEEKFLEIRDDKNPGKLTELILWEEAGPAGIRSIMDALRETQYQLTHTIRLWRALAEDEGLRAVTQFMLECHSVTYLELIECNITALGCEFLGATLGPGSLCQLDTLRLDHNNIGNKGLENLTIGLRMNTTLTELSLAFCGIDADGGRSLIEILINQNSKLETLSLQGNSLQNQGICAVFHAMQVNNALLRLDVADTQFNDQPEVLQKLFEILCNNSTLQILDMRYNGIYDEGATAIIDMFRSGNEGALLSVISEFVLTSSKIDPEIYAELEKAIGNNKRGKKGRKKRMN